MGYYLTLNIVVATLSVKLYMLFYKYNFSLTIEQYFINIAFMQYGL